MFYYFYISVYFKCVVFAVFFHINTYIHLLMALLNLSFETSCTKFCYYICVNCGNLHLSKATKAPVFLDLDVSLVTYIVDCYDFDVYMYYSFVPITVVFNWIHCIKTIFSISAVTYLLSPSKYLYFVWFFLKNECFCCFLVNMFQKCFLLRWLILRWFVYMICHFIETWCMHYWKTW